MGMMKKSQGFTLIEVAIVLTILSVIVVVATMLTRATDKAYHTTTESANAGFFLRRALEGITEEVRRSDSDHLTIDHSDDAYDFLEVQMPLTVKEGSVSWGASSHIGWKVRFLVEDGVLIRRVVNSGGIIMEMDQVLASNIDDDWTDGKGFAVSQNGSLITMTVRVVQEDAGGEWSRQLTTAVSLRN